VVYVWLDALVNYISALGFPNSTNDYHKFWPCDVHVLGKDILRFHAIYWPAFLMAADIDLPKCILAHGWWTNNGEKISKSLGNTIDPVKLVDEFGLDRFRYFLIRETSFGSDGNFSEQNLITRSNSELSNKIGNLVQRVLVFILNNCDAKIPEVDNNLVYEEELIKFAQKTVALVDHHICDFELNIALEKIVELVEAANVYIDSRAPWKLKDSRAEMDFVIYALAEAIRYIGVLLLAFIPDSASKILDYINVPDDERYIDYLKKDFAAKASVIGKPEILFSVLGNK
jgi:methionyl-tRNA synthetase